MKIGILVHGRHVEACGWEKLIWGEKPKKLGVLPMMVLVALNRGIENITMVIFGTGASEKNGLKESEYMKDFLVKNLNRISEFSQIQKHPRYQTARDVALLGKLVNDVVCDTASRNTVEETATAARIFANAGVTEVIQITCASHAPRCLRDSAIAAEKGIIPEGQIWSIVPDMTTYANTTASDVVIIEPPHRGDDPMIKSPIKPHEVFPGFFKIHVNARVSALCEINDIIKKKLSVK